MSGRAAPLWPLVRIGAMLRRRFFREATSERFIRGTFWSVSGMVAAQGLGLIASVLTARLLGRVGFGELGMVSSTALTFGLFAGLGLGMTATKYVAELRSEAPERAGRVAGLCLTLAAGSGVIMSAAVFICAETLSARLLSAPALAPDLRLCSLLLLTNTLSGAQNGVLAGLESFRVMAQINLARGVLNFPLVIVGAWMSGRHGAVFALVISGVAGVIVGHFALIRECESKNVRVSYRDFRGEWSLVWRFSLPALLNELIIGPAMWLGNTIVVQFPGGYGELGILNVGQQWRRILLFLPSVFASVTLPILSSERDTAGARFEATLEMAQRMSIAAVVPVAGLIMCLSGWIVRLYGREFSDAVPVLLGIVVGASISAIASAGGPGIRAKGKIWIETFQNLAWAAVYIVSAAVLCPKWGALALSAGFAAACLVHSTCSYAYLYFAGDVTTATLRRIAAAVAYVIGMGSIALWVNPEWRVWLLAPGLVVGVLGVGARAWSDPYFYGAIRNRVAEPGTRIPLTTEGLDDSRKTAGSSVPAEQA